MWRTDQPEDCRLIFVKVKSGNKIFPSVAIYKDGFKMIHEIDEYQCDQAYFTDYGMTILGWQPIIYPELYENTNKSR